MTCGNRKVVCEKRKLYNLIIVGSFYTSIVDPVNLGREFETGECRGTRHLIHTNGDHHQLYIKVL